MFERLDDEGMDFLYQWLWDRSRGARKDLSLQTIKPKDIPAYLTCVEQCIRFHLLSLHYMAREDAENYDLQIDHGNDIEQLRNCNTSLRARQSDNRQAGIETPNYVEFKAYSIILALIGRDEVYFNETKDIPNSMLNNPVIQTAIALYTAGKTAVSTSQGQSFKSKQQNWINFWDTIRSAKVSYLMACAAELYFNTIRNHILETLRRAYRPPRTGRPSPTEDWTLEKLKYILGLDDHEQVREFCEEYGFEFGVNSQGVIYLDVNSIPQNGALRPPAGLRSLYHSKTLVETKRNGRSFSAVIKGMSVQEATAKGLVDSSASTEIREGQDLNQDDGDSLFIPEGNTARPNIFAPRADVPGSAINGLASTAQGTTGPRLNPFASPFQPSTESPFQAATNTAKPNPFVNPFAAPAQNGSTTTPPFPGATPATIKPGLFDASKNAIQFAQPGVSNGLPSNTMAASPFAQTAPSPFKPGASAAPTVFSNTTTGTATSQPATPWSFSNLAASENKVNGTAASTSFSSQGLLASQSQATANSPFPFPGSQQATAATEQEKQRKAEEQRKVVEEQQRIEDEKQKALQEQQRIAAEQRRAQEDRERQAREAEQRRIQEEQERLRRAQEEAARAQAEQQRRAHEEQQRIIAQQAAERREREAHASALHTLSLNLLMDEEDGLMRQYFDNVVSVMAREEAQRLEDERYEKLADELYERRRLALARAVCARWVELVQRKKRKTEARRRRQALKAFRAEAEALAASSVSDVRPAATNVGQTNGTSSGFKRPVAPASVRRQEEVPKPPTSTLTTNRVKRVAPRAKSPVKIVGRNLDVKQGNDLNGDYSQAYYHSTAPADRTETDWFKLRAMGIDPSKHRKRSFSSMSEGEEDEPVAEPKRARRSPSSTPQHSLRPPTNDEERLARFRAVQQAFNKGGSTPRSFDGNRSSNGRSSLLIARVREELANSPAPQYSPPNAQHDFGRSVPSIGSSKPQPPLSMFGQSIGAPLANERPAYWGRSSRFVPQHLYGKGVEAVRAYRNQLNGGQPVNNEPLELSSPIPTHVSYFPFGNSQQGYVADETLDVDAHIDGYADAESEDGVEDLIDYGDEEYDEVEQEQDEDGYDEQEEEEYSDEGESEMSAEEPFDQFAQKPGATQDDAIELSD